VAAGVGVGVGVALGRRPAAVGDADGVGTVDGAPPDPARADGVANRLAAGTFLGAGPVLVTIFGADALGSNEPTPGRDRGSSPGEATKLMPTRTRKPKATAPVSQPTTRRMRRRRPESSTKIGVGGGGSPSVTTF
jgi:hypothetical protein